MNSALSTDCWSQERRARSQLAGKPQKEQAAQVRPNTAARRGSGPGTGWWVNKRSLYHTELTLLFPTEQQSWDMGSPRGPHEVLMRSP